MKKTILAYSGGLDTSYCAHTLSQTHEVHAVSINTGGFSTQELQDMQKKALALGVTDFKAIEAREYFYEKVIRFLIFGNVLRNNTYPLSVSAERIVQAVLLVKEARQIGAEAIAHGSTGAGNDQVRFDLIFQTLAPELEIISPIRDQSLSREEEIAHLQSHGYDFDWSKSKYSINQGLWGTSVGGAETLTSNQALPEEAYPSALEKTEIVQLELRFEKGEAIGLNGDTLKPVALIEALSELASAYAIGRDVHVGDTIIGIKGRVGFEAAAPLILLKAHELLEKHVLSKWQQFHKQQLAAVYGMLLHEGQYLDPVMRDIEAFLESSQASVSGTVYVRLHPYRFELLGIASPHDLMQSRFGQYGEKNLAWSGEEAKGFIKLLANAGKIHQSQNPS